MDGNRSFDEYRMPDELWDRIKPLLPEYEASPAGGRPRKDLRRVADAIFYRMRTGCQWKAIPPSLAPGSTAHQYFQQWVDDGVFDDLWQMSLREYDDLVGLDWTWQSVDGAMTKAPLGGEATGKNPTDRGKLGTKRSLMTEAAGIPVSVIVDGANTHDIRLLQETIEHCLVRWPRKHCEFDEHLCLDKGYQSASIQGLVESVYRYTAHIRSRGEEKRELDRARGQRPRRWVVERTHSWFNRFRAILVRWEKKIDNHVAALHLACAYFTFSRAGVFG
jgi:putative transposase